MADLLCYRLYIVFCFFKQKTAYEMRISDWSSDVCSSDLPAASAASQLVRSEERETWEALRTLRRKLAEEHGVPPYVIFPDATLLEMLRSQPASLSDMATISGVGARKLERYGQAFLEVLQGSVEVAKSPADLRHELITLARAGMTPVQIARQLDCSEKNVYAM